MRNVLFCPPTYFEVIDVKNPFMQGSAPVDHVRAVQQWQLVQKAFAHAGYGLQQIEAVPGLEDMVFAANQAFVGIASDGKQFIVPSAMRFDSRRREVPYFVEYFRRAGFEILELQLSDGEFLEGHGDLLWTTDNKKVWAGFGFRSSQGGVAKFAKAMAERGIEVTQLELRDPRFYHLDTCLAPLTPDSVLIYPGAFTPATLETIAASCPRVYEVTEEEALQFVCNGVSANGHFITPKLTPALKKALDGEKLTPLVVDTSEFEKSGGSVCCLKVFLP